MLKVTFPHLGNLYIPFKSFLTELGLDPIVPPLTSSRTVALSTKLAPEFACFPFKVNLGNYIEGIEAGAECIFMIGGSGPCRLGYYGEVQREVLKEAGYAVDFLVLEAPQKQPLELWRNLKRYLPRHRLDHFIQAFQIFWLKAEMIDRFDRLVNKIRPAESFPGTCTRLQHNFYRKLDDACFVEDIRSVFTNSMNELESVSRNEAKNIPQIVLLGEIYMVLEPMVNFQIEGKLGEMGVEVKRTIYITDWIKENFYLNFVRPSFHKSLQLLAKPYLHNPVGGHGLQSVAHMVESGINRYHGVVHLAPFTCMPEIIAMQLFPSISAELSIPVLSIIIDEHSAEAGVLTRLEAFVDLLVHRRRQQGVTKVYEDTPKELVLETI